MRDIKSIVIDHILRLREIDIDYAREAFKFYDSKLPWMNLKEAIRERLK